MMTNTQTPTPVEKRGKFEITRRGLVAGALGAGLASALPSSIAFAQPQPGKPRSSKVKVPVIRRGRDPQYDSMIAVYNRRVRADPHRVFTPRTGPEAVVAVQSVIDSDERL